MIVLGAYLNIKPVVKLENVIKGLKKSLPERHHKLIPLNEDAIRMGMKSVEVVHRKELSLDIEILHFLGVLDYKLSSRLNIFSHQYRE